MITILPFVVSESLPEMQAITRAHWEETEWDVCGDGPKPDAAMYLAMEQANNVVAFAAYEDGKIVAYVTVFVYPHLHYGFLFGAHDTLFVRSDLRKGNLGLKLKALASKEVQARGGLFTAWHAKPGSAFEGILQAKHCKPAETIYIERY